MVVSTNSSSSSAGQRDEGTSKPLTTNSTFPRAPLHWHHTPYEKSSGGFYSHLKYHDSLTGLEYLWSSRRHRKGGYPKLHNKLHGIKEVGGDIKRLRWIGFDIYDISWWVAVLFWVGSAFWIANGFVVFVCFFSWTSNSSFQTAGATAFLGGTFFLFGGYLSYVESLNPPPETDSGRSVNTASEKENHDAAVTDGPTRNAEAEQNVHGRLVRRVSGPNAALGHGRHHFGRHATNPNSGDKGASQRQQWKWYGVRSDAGFIANAIQLYGASIFWVSTLCGLWGVLPLDAALGGELTTKTKGLYDGLYWMPQILGAPAFIISGLIFMIEAQTKWWRPSLLSVGWHVGFWNALGGLGFLLCGIFGIWRETENPVTGVQYWGTAFSTFWGSWFFLIGSEFQLLESLNKYLH